jgi:hypothetical protein
MAYDYTDYGSSDEWLKPSSSYSGGQPSYDSTSYDQQDYGYNQPSSGYQSSPQDYSYGLDSPYSFGYNAGSNSGSFSNYDTNVPSLGSTLFPAGSQTYSAFQAPQDGQVQGCIIKTQVSLRKIGVSGVCPN